MNARALIWIVALALAPVHPACGEVLFRSQEHAVLPHAGRRVTISADETPLAAALSLLAVQVGVNIIVAPGVEGAVSLHLQDVPFAEALRALTAGRNVTYYTAGDVVVVAPKAEGSKAGMSTLAFRLRHLRPGSILEATRALLSPEGEAVPLISLETAAPSGGAGPGQEGAPPVIIFRDYPNYLTLLEQSLEALDVPQSQVEIEVKFVEARSEDLKNLGIEWPGSMSVGVTGARVADDSTGLGSGSTDGVTSSTRRYAYTNDLNAGDVRWGSLTVSDVQAIINYLVTSEHGRVLSQPRLAVMDNEEATIHVTTTTPVQTINRFSEGAIVQDVATYQYVEVGITLTVRPRISDDGYISLKVRPVFEEIVGFVGPTISPAPVTAKRSVETTIKVKTAETVVLGGLVREREVKREAKLWLLGDLPLVGSLFRNTRTEKEQGELLIMITPTILPPG